VTEIVLKISSSTSQNESKGVIFKPKKV